MSQLYDEIVVNEIKMDSTADDSVHFKCRIHRF